jgi:antitoxin component of MazEF toxin-antitoxin module
MKTRDQRSAGGTAIKSARPEEYDVAELVKKITPENLHREFDFGDPVGKEAW